MKTPIGQLGIDIDNKTVSRVQFDTSGTEETDAEYQLREYFDGKRVNFDLTLASDGTIFQKQAWEELQKIPFGETATYAEIAKRIGRPEAWRAVANACAANPILIIIPCHRVVGSFGKMGGYAGGVDRKRWLLEHEAAIRSRLHRE